jgi:hypothetical protein
MRLSLLTVALVATTSATAAGPCPFAPWSGYLGSTLLRLPQATAYVFATESVQVDADGAPNAYHPDDAALHCTKGTGFKGLDCPANAGYPQTVWWPSVLVPDPANPNRPFVQPSPGEFAGYFVSQTSLQDKTKAATDPARYVDSRKVPYLVFPGNFYKMKGTGALGDVGFAINAANGKSSAFIVADVGPPAAALGEMSMALASALGGADPNPRTGSGTPSGKIIYVVFPGSGAETAWPMSNDHLASKASDLLRQVGGVEALLSCKDAL